MARVSNSSTTWQLRDGEQMAWWFIPQFPPEVLGVGMWTYLGGCYSLMR